MMKKNKKRIWHVVVASVISVPFLFSIWGMYKTFYMSGITSRDLDDYISGRYLSFPGGEEIRGCIPAYKELDGYESLRFTYADGRGKSNFFRTFYVSFTLRVQYSEEEYLERKREAGVTDTWLGGSSEYYRFVEKGSLNHVLYGVECNDTYHYIEYVALCGSNGDAIQEGYLFLLLPWNRIY